MNAFSNKANKLVLVRASHMYPFFKTIREIGAPLKKLLAESRLKIDMFDDPNHLIPELPLWHFIEQVSRSQGIEEFGFLATENCSLDHFGTFGHFVCRSETLHHALQTFIYTMQCQSNCPPFWLEEDESCVWFCRQGTPGILTGQWRMEQHVVSLMVQLVRLAAGEYWTPQEVRLQAHEIHGYQKTNTLTQSLLYIGQPYTAVAIEKELLIQPLKHLNADKDGLEEKAACEVSNSIADNIIQLVSQSYFDINVAPVDIAKTLGLSLRSLQRHLSQESFNLKQIISQQKFRLAKQMLQDKEFDISAIGQELGYSELPHFSRAFKRWSGISPNHYRRLETA